MWNVKTVFGYKMNSALWTDASLQSVKLIQAYVFHMYTFFRELRWPFLPPIPAHNTMTSLSPATTLRVYKIHTTAFIKKKKKMSMIYLCLFRLRLWSHNRFVRFKVHFTVIPISTIPPDLLECHLFWILCRCHP